MIKRLIRYTRHFFSFNYAEAKGFLVMAGGIAAMGLFYIIYNALPGEGYNSYSADKAQLDSLLRLIEAREEVLTEKTSRTGGERASAARVITYFPFNPNQLSADSFQLLGAPEWLAARILKYRQKGGQFRRKEDLLKIYGFPDSLYASIESFIIIPPPLPPQKNNNLAFEHKYNKAEKEETSSVKVISINLNKADSLQLQEIKGIGPVLSSRIVRFRDKMGGYVHLRQLNEVYGLDSVLVEQLKKVTYIEPDFQPAKIAVNTASREALAAHPYISPVQARLIFTYREQHGRFNSVDDLLRIHTLDSEFVNKIAPYIRLD